jgi:hypothetical protein
MEIEMGYKPGDSEAKLCGTVKLIWNSPTATSAAALAGIVTVPIVTDPPLRMFLNRRSQSARADWFQSPESAACPRIRGSLRDFRSAP